MKTKFDITIELEDRDSCNGCPLVNDTICQIGFGRLILYRRKGEAFVLRPLACKIVEDKRSAPISSEGCSHEWIDITTKVQGAQGIKVEACSLCDIPIRVIQKELEKNISHGAR